MQLPIASPTMWLRWLALLYVLISTGVAQTPYNPTRILRNGTQVYVFQPSTQTSGQFELGIIDLSSQVQAARLPYTTQSASLPFLDNNATRAFLPILDDDGHLTVYTGDCAEGANGGQIWTFAPGSSKSNSKATWKQEVVSISSTKQTTNMGANYLNGGMSFSSVVGGDTSSMSLYVFGGMCPTANATSNDWQADAIYSNLMLTLQPSASGKKSIKYEMAVSASRGPPVPEAGFSLTGLDPTFSNRSDGTQTQQQNFLLIGGHTSTAFINMSQIALFSLPEQSWTFIGVNSNSGQTRLARSGATTIDPRSGHTAVLTPDGQRIIVFGGWVGDISTPAEPQYMVLDVANGYGGKDDWQWTVPSTSGAGPDSSGLYGHGATMLPGGVMMITGGFSISSASRSKRQTQTANQKSYFFNTTSYTWTTSYTPPPDMPFSAPIKTGPLSSTGQKAGLGVGLGVGLAAVCGLFAFYIWYTKRLQKRREVREKEIQEMSHAAHRYNMDSYSPGFDGRGGQTDALDYLASQNGSYYFPPGSQGGQGWKQATGGDAERTGLLVEIPSPTRGLRRSLSNRPAYAMTRIRGPGNIHPIDEIDEEQDEERHADGHPSLESNTETQLRPTPEFGNTVALDPFTDSHTITQLGPKRSAPSSPMHDDAEQAEHIAGSWPLGAGTAPHLLHSSQHGKVSPDKAASERTSSNLSERSTNSNLSWTSSSHGSGMVPNTSIRSPAILSHGHHSNPFRSPDQSPIHDTPRQNSGSGRESPTDPRTQSLTSSRGHLESETFHTAHSSFVDLQAEGVALLGGNPERHRPGTASSVAFTYRDTEATYSRATTTTPTTSLAIEIPPSRPTTRERRRSWLGSVRRVLTRSTSGAERTRSLMTSMSYHEPYTDHPTSSVGPNVNAPSNRKSPDITSAPPRRAASDASFWRSKRGKQDWLDEETDPTWRRNSGDDWGAPEDIALAERERERQEWRQRNSALLVDLHPSPSPSPTKDLDLLPTPRTPIRPDQLGIPPSSLDDRPETPASEVDWDVEAAVERRVVQVMFTVPRSKLRVVNADVERSSVLSLPRENSKEGDDLLRSPGSPDTSLGAAIGTSSAATTSSQKSSRGDESPGRVKDLAGRFEQMNGGSPRLGARQSPRPSPRPSPSPSLVNLKVRGRVSRTSLAGNGVRRKSGEGDA